uniref:Uncharacterized protein n=1 Tax=Parascaris univalens TaxID=6257 RepID=A0A915BAV6_PARUN
MILVGGDPKTNKIIGKRSSKLADSSKIGNCWTAGCHHLTLIALTINNPLNSLDRPIRHLDHRCPTIELPDPDSNRLEHRLDPIHHLNFIQLVTTKSRTTYRQFIMKVSSRGKNSANETFLAISLLHCTKCIMMFDEYGEEAAQSKGRNVHFTARLIASQ